MSLKLSFITAVKNRAEECREMLQSLVRQDMKDWEAIIVDDHSTEPILETVASLTEGRFRYFRLPETLTGVSNARNFAVEKAEADILLIADGDDINEPMRARVTYEEMIKKDYDVFYSPIRDFIPEKRRRVMHPFQPFDDRLFKMFNFVMNPSAAFRKDIFYKAGKFDPTFEISEDYDLYLRMLKCGAKFGYSEKVLVNYRRSEDSLSILKFPKMHNSIMQCRIKNGIEPFDIDDVKKYALPEIAQAVLSPRGRKLWQDDRFEGNER